MLVFRILVSLLTALLVYAFTQFLWSPTTYSCERELAWMIPVLVVNLIAIWLPRRREGKSWLSMYLQRKKLEELVKIGALRDRRESPDGTGKMTGDIVRSSGDQSDCQNEAGQ